MNIAGCQSNLVKRLNKNTKKSHNNTKNCITTNNKFKNDVKININFKNARKVKSKKKKITIMF